MQVFDFDKTIYDGDSTRDFYLFCLSRQPSLALLLPRQAVLAVPYLLGRMSKTRFKEHFYRFLPRVKDIDRTVEEFWDKNLHKIKKWYFDVQREDDLVISASPEFLVIPACNRVGITHVMASRVNPRTGKCRGKNCRDREKVRRFRQVYGDVTPEVTYSDSYADSPLAEISERAVLVRGDELLPWGERKR